MRKVSIVEKKCELLQNNSWKSAGVCADGHNVGCRNRTQGLKCRDVYRIQRKASPGRDCEGHAPVIGLLKRVYARVVPIARCRGAHAISWSVVRKNNGRGCHLDGK